MKPRMSASPPPLAPPDDDTEEDEEDALDRTIGRAAGRHATTPPARTNGHGGAPRNGHAPAAAAGNGDDTDTSTDSPPASTSPPRRPRAQTGAGARTHPLKLRTRAQSTDRTALEEEREPRTPWSASFRDPLVVRREALEARVKSAPVPPKVVAGKPRAPVGELVAFFDKS
ncbi:hypothetical protein BC834DRAFT_879065 [Gloeopeniophorella convolvens]|nr:hypothetical protein BC834DRAFT_879065 [Gloeopeniophorella convolvens]